MGRYQSGGHSRFFSIFGGKKQLSRPACHYKPRKPAIICQTWAGIGPMLAVAGWYRSGYVVYLHGTVLLPLMETVSIQKRCLIGIRIPIIKIRRSHDPRSLLWKSQYLERWSLYWDGALVLVAVVLFWLLTFNWVSYRTFISSLQEYRHQCWSVILSYQYWWCESVCYVLSQTIW